jgi:hypothetical protein
MTRALRRPVAARDWIVLSASLSVAKPMPALIVTTPSTTMASASPPVITDNSAEPASSATGRLLSWDSRICAAERRGGSGRRLGPCAASRARAAAALSPEVLDAPSACSTAPASSVCHARAGVPPVGISVAGAEYPACDSTESPSAASTRATISSREHSCEYSTSRRPVAALALAASTVARRDSARSSARPIAADWRSPRTSRRTRPGTALCTGTTGRCVAGGPGARARSRCRRSPGAWNRS